MSTTNNGVPEINVCFQCYLCHDLLVHPIRLSLCKHKFCQLCLYRYFTTSQRKMCPECYRLFGVSRRIRICPIIQLPHDPTQKAISWYYPDAILQRTMLHQEAKKQEWLPVARLWNIRRDVCLVPIEIPTRLTFTHKRDREFLRWLSKDNNQRMGVVIPCSKKVRNDGNVIGLYIDVRDIVSRINVNNNIEEDVDCTITCYRRVQILDHWSRDMNNPILHDNVCLTTLYSDTVATIHDIQGVDQMEIATQLLHRIWIHKPDFFLGRPHLFYQSSDEIFPMQFPLDPINYCWWIISLVMESMPSERVKWLFTNKSLLERYIYLIGELKEYIKNVV